MAEAAAGFLEQTYTQTTQQERYGISYRNLRVMGRLAIKEMVDSPEYVGALQESWTDFYTAVGENLVTDPDYTEYLHFDPLESRQIVDGHVVDKTGTHRIVNLVDAGYQAAIKAAETNAEMMVEAERAEGDCEIARIVDTLAVSESYTLLSMDPKDELERNPDFWQDQLHYRKGMAVIQHYYRKSETELLAGNYSLHNSDMDALRRIFAEYNVHIPYHESPNRWSRYGIKKSITEIEAQNFGPKLVSRHRLETAQATETISVTSLVAEHIDTVQKYFSTYIVPLSPALVSGRNNETMQSFALSMLHHAKDLNADERRRLMHITNSNLLSEEDAGIIEEKVRYALVEELRKYIPALLAETSQPTPAPHIQIASASVFEVQQCNPLQLHLLNQQASRNVAAGSSAGRTYGGCSGAGSKNNDPGQNNDAADSQKVFGGADENNKNSDDTENIECEYSGTFCYCCPYNTDGTPLSSPVEVTARRNKNGVASCLRSGCGATIDKSGKGSRGRIYEKAMRLARLKVVPEKVAA